MTFEEIKAIHNQEQTPEGRREACMSGNLAYARSNKHRAWLIKEVKDKDAVIKRVNAFLENNITDDLDFYNALEAVLQDSQ